MHPSLSYFFSARHIIEPQINIAITPMTTIKAETMAAVRPKLMRLTVFRFDRNPLQLVFRDQTCLP
ncbi:hypothetical protein DFP96_10922 [Listeria rocourtiae]|uniref:Uncharacterized protein n=1 Tax=Listeria rocourtiae TaxID=647910 RepID=A0A4R6ZIP9_9LIST|nr:hypothetical protein DFP96_10922 [Listeria rocourtiae]